MTETTAAPTAVTPVTTSTTETVATAAAAPTVTGTLPNAEGTPTGSIRISAMVDLTYENGVLTGVGFNAAQYTVFQSGTKLGVKSSFPKRGSSTITR